MNNIPLATKGIKGKLVKTFTIPQRALEAMDQFFLTLSEGAEKKALELRQNVGIKLKDTIENLAREDAKYRTFRQDLFKEGQGSLLDAIDEVTQSVSKLRNSENKLVSIPAKFTVPFLKTVMNVFKQGIEYTPAGFLTMLKSKNKVESFTKALMGTATITAISSLLGSDRLTWGEPTNDEARNNFRAEGKQAYSFKIGDTWYSYEKLPPVLGFNFALIASINDLLENQKITDDFADLVLGAVAKYASFMSDQSYAKSIGDMLNFTKGGEGAVTNLIGNYTQQLVPYRAMGGWLTKLFDDTQRKADPEGTFIEKQVQKVMMNIPGLSQKVPARTTSSGEEVKYNNKILNLFSPIKTSTEKDEGFSKLSKDKQKMIKEKQKEAAKKAKAMQKKIEAKQKMIQERAKQKQTEIKKRTQD